MGAALELANVEVRNPRGRVLARAGALTLPAGTSLGLRGPSGAGKSTLLFALAGLLEGVAGRVSWSGTDILALNADKRAKFRARHIGMIFQDHLLFDEMDASQNAGLAALFRPKAERAAVKDRATAHLERLGIDQGSQSVASFSGGERQRVAVARALAGDADILLADEPTASLDRAAADALIEDLVDLVKSRGVTLIAASHDAALLDRMDQVAEMRDGVLHADGEGR